MELTLEKHLAGLKASGRKLLVPYITGGYPENWTELIPALAAAGADAIEVGIPFSDPVMDGPTIQESSSLALDSGATPESIMTDLRSIESPVPLIAMTYYNIAFRMGHSRFAANLAESGFSGAILPDLSLEEAAGWMSDAAAQNVAPIMLGAPTSDDERLHRIAEASRGFVYAVGLVGITGERNELAASATDIAKRLKQHTEKPVLVGVGISNGSQAAEVSQVADGVIVGSALIRKVLDTGGIGAGVELISSIREALDA